MKHQSRLLHSGPQPRAHSLQPPAWLLFFIWFLLVWPTISAADKLTVYTVNYPLAYFAQRIGGEHVEVVFPAPKNVDPAFWMPNAETIQKYQLADLILLNGAGYAKWVNKVSLPRSHLVNTSQAFKRDYITSRSGVTHSHGPVGDHSHEGVAFTTWIDLLQAVAQAEFIKDVLIRKCPNLKDYFEKEFLLLEQELLELDRAIQAMISEASAQPILASHPVYQYFARRYELNLKSVMWEPDVMPDDVQWQALEYWLKDHPAKWMIWEDEPIPQTVAKLKKLGIRSLVFNTCANVPDEGDFISVMKQNARNLGDALR